MLTKKYRPKSFAEVRGAVPVKEALMAIARHPDTAPRSILLCGPWGIGKTSTARIFARAVNCEQRDGEACNVCSMCQSIHDGSPLYVELDSAVVGNVDVMRSTRESFGYSIQKGNRVIVFDETQLVSPQAQSALLTILEEAPPGVFFLFCTTNPENILPTILSRSLVLQFEPLQESDIAALIKSITTAEKMPVSDKAIAAISRRVRGHARDALQQLEFIKLKGEEKFLAQNVFLEDLFSAVMTAFQNGETEAAHAVILKIMQHPVLFIDQDFYLFLQHLCYQNFIATDVEKNPYAKDLIFTYLKYHHLLRNSNDWYLFLNSLATTFETQAKPGIVVSPSRFSK